MEYYVSKNHNRLNGVEFCPESVSNTLCLSPHYNATVNEHSRVILDSGAFQDVSDCKRLTFSGALDRQKTYFEKLQFIPEYIVSYDRLVDEKITIESGRIKERADKDTARKYVKETIDAAKYLADHRGDVDSKLILSCQGVTKRQYQHCVRNVLEFMETDDVLGLGGFCIVGQRLSLHQEFLETIEWCCSKIKEKGIKKMHLFGVGAIPLLTRAYIIGRKYNISMSYDTSSYEFNSTMGKIFNPTTFKLSKTFFKEEKGNEYQSASLALFNINNINNYWKNLEIMLTELESNKDKNGINHESDGN